MITRIMRVLLRFAPLRRLFWRRWYQSLTKHQQQSDFTFMNYGFVYNGDLGRQPTLNPEHEYQRNWIQLYHHVATGADIVGKEVVEIGSGRGGGAAYIHQYLKPASMLGIDLASKAVDFSTRVHGTVGLSYRQGNAEAIPLPDASVDVVVNVESSHCYGSMPNFLAEVTRILRPGGFFCFADLRTVAGNEQLKQELDATGMTIIKEENIASNVLAALKIDNDMKLAYIRDAAPKWLWEPLDTFAGVEGSAIWQGLESGSTLYPHVVMQKHIA